MVIAITESELSQKRLVDETKHISFLTLVQVFNLITIVWNHE